MSRPPAWLALLFCLVLTGCMASVGGHEDEKPDAAPPAPATFPDSLREPDPGSGLRGAVVVTLDAMRAVAFVNPDTRRVFAVAPVGIHPRDLVPSYDGSVVYVVNFAGDQFDAGSISVVSLASRREIDRFNLYPYGAFHGMASTRADVNLYVASETRRSVLELNLRSRQIGRTFELPHGVPNQVALDPTETRLYVTDGAGPNLFVVNLTDGTITETRVGRGPESVTVTPDGSAVWVANRDDGTVSVLDPFTLVSLATLSSGRAPVRVVFTPDGGRAYVANAGEGSVTVFDGRTRARLGAIAIGLYPLGVAVDPGGPEGGAVYVASTRDDILDVISVGRQTVVDKVQVGAVPFGVAYVGR